MTRVEITGVKSIGTPSVPTTAKGNGLDWVKFAIAFILIAIVIALMSGDKKEKKYIPPTTPPPPIKPKNNGTYYLK